MKAWPHLIYSNLTQNPPYSIPRWVDDLASSFVTAICQITKSDFFLVPVNLGISQDRDIQLTLQGTKWPHLIYSNLTQNPPYSIPRWVDDLASYFVTAVFQTLKSCFFMPVNLGISWDWDIQLTLQGSAWPHLIYSNLTQNPAYSIPRWVDDLAFSFVTAVFRFQNSGIFLSW